MGKLGVGSEKEGILTRALGSQGRNKLKRKFERKYHEMLLSKMPSGEQKNMRPCFVDPPPSVLGKEISSVSVPLVSGWRISIGWWTDLLNRTQC
jgi:hypothetical protein